MKRPLQKKCFSEKENAVWRLLYAQQMERVQASGKVHSMLLEGYRLAALPADHCPDAIEMSERLFALRGRKLTDAKDPYLSDKDRYTPLHAKHFPATNYIRSMETLAFTPLPDLAHDYFGHMPQIFHSQLSHLQWRIADLYFRSDTVQKNCLFNFAWYVIEYSAIIEHEVPKIFGAGLLSSPGDFGKFLAGGFTLISAELEKICQTSRSPIESHQHIYVYESFDHMMQLVDEFEKSL